MLHWRLPAASIRRRAASSILHASPSIGICRVSQNYLTHIIIQIITRHISHLILHNSIQDAVSATRHTTACAAYAHTRSGRPDAMTAHTAIATDRLRLSITFGLRVKRLNIFGTPLHRLLYQEHRPHTSLRLYLQDLLRHIRQRQP